MDFEFGGPKVLNLLHFNFDMGRTYINHIRNFLLRHLHLYMSGRKMLYFAGIRARYDNEDKPNQYFL